MSMLLSERPVPLGVVSRRGGPGGPAAGTILLIACPDLDPAALPLDSREGVRVLCRPGGAVPPPDEADGPLLDALGDAVAGGGMCEIVVCGHSRCALNPRERGREAEPPGFERLLADMRRAAVRRREAQRAVVTALGNLSAYPSLAAARWRGSLRLRGWFYRNESGLVQGYDEGRDEFVTLGGRL